MACTSAQVRGAFHQLCQRICSSGRLAAQRLEAGPAGVVSPVAVHEQEAPEALGLERADQLAEHGAVRLGRERRAAGVRGEVRRDPVRQRRQHRDAERLRRLDGDPLGEDLVDREREVGVLLDGAERQHDPVVGAQVLLELHPVAVLDSHPAILSYAAATESSSSSSPAAAASCSPAGSVPSAIPHGHRDRRVCRRGCRDP